MKPSLLIISSDLTCGFILEEKRLPPLGGSPQQAEASAGPERGLGERRPEFDGLPLGPCSGFLSALLHFELGYFFVWSLLLLLWPRVAQDSRNPLEMLRSEPQGSCGDVSCFTFCQKKMSWRTGYLLLHSLCCLTVFICLQEYYQ